MAGYYGKNYEEPKDALVEASQESSTPAVDYSDSPFYEGNTDSNADIVEDDDEEKKKQEPQAEAAPAAPQGEVETAKAANGGQSYTDTAVANLTGEQQPTQSDPVASMQRDGIPNNVQQGLAKAYQLIASGQGTLEEFKNDPTAGKYYDLYMKYYGEPAQQTTSAPDQSTTQNQILPSAGGNYQADRIYDPSKTYGRQPDGSYVFSNSARELQNNLAREGYYKGAIDGYFGQQTQEALDAYLAEHGIKAEPDKGSDALTQAAAEAPKAETPSNVDQALKNYAESIRPESTQATDYKAVLEALESVNQSPEQTAPTTESTSLPAPTAATEATGEVYGTPQTASPVNGRHYEGVGNKAQNPDKVAQESNGYTMNTPSAPTEGSAYWDANREPVYSNESPNTNGETSYFRGDETPVDPYVAELEAAYAASQGNSPTGAPVYGEPRYGGVQAPYVPEEKQPMTGNSMSAALESKQPSGPISSEEYYKQLHDLFQIGTPEGDYAAKEFRSRYEPIYGTGGDRKDGIRFGLAKSNWNDGEENQIFERDYYRHLSPRDIYDWQQRTDEANLKYGHEPYGAYKRAQEYERWLADRGLTLSDGAYMYDLNRRPGQYAPEDLNHDTSAYYDTTKPEVHYGDTRSTTIEDAEQLALYDELENLYRNSVASPYSDTNIDDAIPGTRGLGGRPAKINSSFDSNSDTIASDDVQSSVSPNAPIEYSDAFIFQEKAKDSYSPYQSYNDNYKSELEKQQRERESHYGDPMSRALADNQTRPNTNIFAQDAPPVITPQREEQYKTLFGNEISALRQMYPDASYSQLYDYLRLFYEQNGDTDTEYYRWFNSFL